MKFRNQMNNLKLPGCAIRKLFVNETDDFDEYAEMPNLLEIQDLYSRHLSPVENGDMGSCKGKDKLFARQKFRVCYAQRCLCVALCICSCV